LILNINIKPPTLDIGWYPPHPPPPGAIVLKVSASTV
jgi:hypothetical protein